MLRAPGLGGFGETLKLDVRSLDHPLQVEHKLGVHAIVGRSESVQRCRAGGMEDPEHAQLLKAAFVDSPVFLLCGGQNPEDQERRSRRIAMSAAGPSFSTTA